MNGWGLHRASGATGTRALLLALTITLAPALSYGFDEIQVYNADIAEVGQWTVQQHLNYAFAAPKDPPFPGGFPARSRAERHA